MAANITDYIALQNAKTKTDKDFEEMLANLNSTKAKIDEMNENSWKGSSGTVFNEVFNEIKAEINKERQVFNSEIDNKLKIWFESFDETEKAEAQRAENM